MPTTRNDRAERAEIEFERVADVQREYSRREFDGQAEGEVAVDFDRRQVPGRRDERPRQCCLTGANFDEVVAGRGAIASTIRAT